MMVAALPANVALVDIDYRDGSQGIDFARACRHGGCENDGNDQTDQRTTSIKEGILLFILFLLVNDTLEPPRSTSGVNQYLLPLYAWLASVLYIHRVPG